MEGGQIDVLARINQLYPELSPTYRKIADYLIQHHRDAAFLPASRLAAEIGVSESMVIRFASELGYSGYSGLAREIQNYVRQWLLPSDRLRNVAPIQGGDPVGVIDAVLGQDELNLRVSANDFVNRAFPQAISLITAARQVFLVGLHGMAHQADLLGYLLDELNVPTIVLTRGDSALFQALRQITAEDVLVAFAYSRYTQRTLDAMQVAREKGAAVITLTDALTSPPAIMADVVLRSAVTSSSFIASHTAGVAMVSALAAAVKPRQGRPGYLDYIPAGEMLPDPGREPKR